MVQPCFPDEGLILKQQHCTVFNASAKWKSKKNNSAADGIGAMCSGSPTTLILRKDVSETQKTVLQLKDEPGIRIKFV